MTKDSETLKDALKGAIESIPVGTREYSVACAVIGACYAGHIQALSQHIQIFVEEAIVNNNQRRQDLMELMQEQVNDNLGNNRE